MPTEVRFQLDFQTNPQSQIPNRKICWVNPWKWNFFDEPNKGWIDWEWFYDAISQTFNLEGSLQYLTPIQAAVFAATNN